MGMRRRLALQIRLLRLWRFWCGSHCRWYLWSGWCGFFGPRLGLFNDSPLVVENKIREKLERLENQYSTLHGETFQKNFEASRIDHTV